MKVLLLNTPTDHQIPEGFVSDSAGLGYIASILRRDGHEVEILDALLRDLKRRETVQEILARDFDCLGITANYEQRYVTAHIIHEVGKQKKDRLLMVGGYLPTLNTKELLDSCPEIDIIVRGEGELVVSDLLGRINRGEDWHETPGIAYVQGSDLVVTSAPEKLNDLDSLPFPARDGILQRPKDRPIRHVRIVGSRGCYGRCSFCSIRAFHKIADYHAPRFRSPKNIVDELESTIAITGLTNFKFVDDDFIGPGPKTREHAMNLAEELRARKLPITFEIECRADTADEDVLKALKNVGLYKVFLGVESGVQSQLDRYNKHVTVEQNRKGIELVRRLDLQLTSGFIAFDPYITVSEVATNLKFLSETGIGSELGEAIPGELTHKALSTLVVVPGTPFSDRLMADGLLKTHGLHLRWVYKDRLIRILSTLIQGVQLVTRLLKNLTRSKR